jgi:putative membrane protein
MKTILLAGAALAATVICVATAGAAPKAVVSAQDKNWLTTSIQGDLFEIMGGKMALQKSDEGPVRALGQRLISDHSKSLKDAAKIARSLGIKVPTEPTPSEQWELKNVSALSGEQFDWWWSTLELYDHSQDLEETHMETASGTNPMIRDEARKDIPMLTMHAKMSKRAVAAARGDG